MWSGRSSPTGTLGSIFTLFPDAPTGRGVKHLDELAA
ncbi:MAG: DNA/RNA nuclease SfsA, partial [Synergistaceae bacterium]|nr:DNA/RNA nuclease SfsA [Synergistaceae bacterium]